MPERNDQALEPALLTADGLRSRWGISRAVAYRLLARGEIAAVKLGSRTLFDDSSVAAFVRRQPRLGGNGAAAGAD